MTKCVGRKISIGGSIGNQDREIAPINLSLYFISCESSDAMSIGSGLTSRERYFKNLS